MTNAVNPPKALVDIFELHTVAPIRSGVNQVVSLGSR